MYVNLIHTDPGDDDDDNEMIFILNEKNANAVRASCVYLSIFLLNISQRQFKHIVYLCFN